MYRNEAKTHEKSAPEVNKKRCLKTELKKTKKTQKYIPTWLQKTDSYFGGNSSWGAFGGPNRFCDEKVGSQRSQSALKNEQCAKVAGNEPKIRRALAQSACQIMSNVLLKF